MKDEASKSNTKTPLLALLVMSGPSQGEKLPLDHAFILGRDKGSKIALNDDRISRHHAMVEIIDHRPALRDLGSKNGTFVNGIELKEVHFLQTNDRVRVGKTLLCVIPYESKEESSDKPVTPSVPGEARQTREAQKPDFDSISHDPSEKRKSTPPPEPGEVPLDTLRRAVNVAGQISSLADNEASPVEFLSLLAETFECENGALFLRSSPVKAFVMTGDQFFIDNAIGKIEYLLMRRSLAAMVFQGGKTKSRREERDGNYLSFPMRLQEKGRVIGLFHRETKSFTDSDLHLCDALAECLRIVPLDNFFKEAATLDKADHLNQIIGSSQVMAEVRERIDEIAPQEGPILMLGESGTGKELCARAMAQMSPRARGPFVVLGQESISDELAEVDLFGHEYGGFDDSKDSKKGKLELARGGVLYIQEAADLPLPVQESLLSVMRGAPFHRVGGETPLPLDARIIFASTKRLDQLANSNDFHPELFREISQRTIQLPPLRDRREDIPELIQYFLTEITRDLGAQRHIALSSQALRRMLSYSWEGNVRELSNVLKRMIVLADKDQLDVDDLPMEIANQRESTTMKLPRLQVLTEMIEREEISRALQEAKGHKSNAAKLLGISRPTLDKKIKLYGLGSLIHSRIDDE